MTCVFRRDAAMRAGGAGPFGADCYLSTLPPDRRVGAYHSLCTSKQFFGTPQISTSSRVTMGICEPCTTTSCSGFLVEDPCSSFVVAELAHLTCKSSASF